MHAPHPDGSSEWYSYPMQQSSQTPYQSGAAYSTFQPQTSGFQQHQNSHSATSFLTDERRPPSGEAFSIWDVIGVGNLDGTEPPLLQELGINPSHIAQKSLTVLNPFRKVAPEMMDESDLAGPIAICLALGGSLLISGKIHFGYIYGLSMLGWLSIFLLVNLMAEDGRGIDGTRTASVLGYSLLPMVPLGPLLGALSHLLKALHAPPFISSAFTIGLGIAMVLWCTIAASSIFTGVLQMQHQRLLLAYPLSLLYTCFALLSVF
ncbi:hypothetical protein DI09_55p150 [Mitosporidium daphniae]|uniref:Protein YIP n=1 Tax=Mitosporidium daphniae TaxID=1485682 RepID=A0A098VP38_9MICR|nr:uncharacterized protein DI09_55p150 [Mitosporidium daphniae]KGG50798.1 hypothetical protein DI09_55p150 [Mitosporidium daphniae]|eukprot:XP_013237225.1 uncharacterized protein DI09_55p150 [Mitosporidium daphniae]